MANHDIPDVTATVVNYSELKIIFDNMFEDGMPHSSNGFFYRLVRFKNRNLLS